MRENKTLAVAKSVLKKVFSYPPQFATLKASLLCFFASRILIQLSFVASMPGNNGGNGLSGKKKPLLSFGLLSPAVLAKRFHVPQASLTSSIKTKRLLCILPPYCCVLQ